MRYIVMHKVDANMEAGGPPSEQIIQQMGALVGEGLKSGVFLDGAGLHRSALRARLKCAGGTCKVTKGPLKGDNELVAGFVMINAKSLDDAIDHARRIASVLGNAELDIGPVVEPWDLGIVPKPANLEGGKFLIIHKSDAASEAGAPLEPNVLAAVHKLVEEMTAAGVLVKTEGLAPSSQGARLAAGPKGKRTWTDGPFTETKEMIAGFSILNVASKADAIRWADRYAEILGGNEVDVRLMREPTGSAT